MKFSLLGIIFILYGLIKLLIVLSLTWFIPPDIEKKLSMIEGIDLIVSGDHTLAGRMIEYILLAFGIFTILHGAALMEIFSAKTSHYIESKDVQYAVYSALGLFSIVFYTLVLYTKLPIDKDPASYDNYKLYGYIGGLSFLLVPVIWEFLEYIFPILDNLNVANQMMWMTVLMLFGIGGISTIYYALKKSPSSPSSPEKTL